METAPILRVSLVVNTEGLSKQSIQTCQKILGHLENDYENPWIDSLSSQNFLSQSIQQDFLAKFGLPYSKENYGKIRYQFIQNSDSIVAVKFDQDESFAIDLMMRLNSRLSKGTSFLILRPSSAPAFSNVLLSLASIYQESEFHYAEFTDNAHLKKIIQDFIPKALAFYQISGQAPLGKTIQELPISNKKFIKHYKLNQGGHKTTLEISTQPSEIFSSFSNVNILGTSYQDRFIANRGSPGKPDQQKSIRASLSQEGFAEEESINSFYQTPQSRDSLKKATLYLQSGFKMTGYSFGADVSRSGEAVFQTAMTGYPECFSDPSYREQIIVCSSTILGQYGVPARDRDRYGLLKKFESEDVHISGLVITDYSFNYSHFQAFQSLSAWLKQYNVPAIYGWEVDTRQLIIQLRKHGSTLAKLIQEDQDERHFQYSDPNQTNLIAQVSVKEPVYFSGGPIRVILVDFGVKNHIIRCLLDRGVSLLVVPWNYNLDEEQFDGIMLSNGPGDPQMMTYAIENLKRQMKKDNPVPIMGVCMGNQVLGMAAGATTYKLTYGNRGHNQPVVDLSTGKTYISSQNHGFAINGQTLPPDWEQYFINLNDHSNEGIRHIKHPFFSVQFHPEANGGPWDTRFLFDIFMHNIVKRKFLSNDKSLLKLTINPELANQLPGLNHLYEDSNGIQKLRSPYNLEWRRRDRNLRKVLVIGSGPLQIGQAGEFDYSGCQAILTLKEEGIQTVLVNPNIATVQTRIKGLADQVYLSPLTVDSLESIIKKERPDGVFLGFGGQTALNLGIKLDELGIFKKYGVQVLGTPISAIQVTEDRELFNQKLQQINEPIAKGLAACNIDDALRIASSIIGYPVIIRAAYALGGLGSGFANNDEDLVNICTVAFVTSNQVLIEKDLRGWKELEYEVVRDQFGNCITPAALENLNPMGIHTGESIVVCPLQTITDDEHFTMRNKALKIIRHIGVIGECNIQFAMNPKNSSEIYVIEVNARLSRSSALASKATCYPLAHIAAKIMLGYSLPAIMNTVTKITSANFEPSLDYIVIKIPRWDMVKFSGVSRKLGPMMKSVGEIMAIGRTFEEAIQKGLRMIDPNQIGFSYSTEAQAVKEFESVEACEEELKRATDRQMFCIYQCLKRKTVSLERIHELSRIDNWFLSKLQRIVEIENVMATFETLGHLPKTILKDAKDAGFSDRQIAKVFGVNEIVARSYRKSYNIVPYVKKIDTLAGEFPCNTNNLYITYNAQFDEVEFVKEKQDDLNKMSHQIQKTSSQTHESSHPIKKGIIIVGGGCYRIGSSVEFDWCSVEFIRQLQVEGIPTVMINNNPETVSTDHTMSDRLYFEEISFETVMDIYEKENPMGVCVSYGGQLPQNIALRLEKAGAKILGHSSESIDSAENRIKFSNLLHSLNIDQPAWAELTNLEGGLSFAQKVGYPVVCRPSYVLSGAAMRLVNCEEELKQMLISSTDVSPDHPVAISKFQPDSMEVEFDGVSQNGRLLVYAISHHVENAGVHSGDATLIFPSQDLSPEAIAQCKALSEKLSVALKINGPFNCQYLYKDGAFKVIELNLRASRSFPFVCKILGINFLRPCAHITIGKQNIPAIECDPVTLGIKHVGCKAPKFSYKRLLGSDPLLGLEMASTGEVGTLAVNKHVAFLKSYISTTDFLIPPKNSNILISCDYAHELNKLNANQHLEWLTQNYNVYLCTNIEKNQIPLNDKINVVNFAETELLIKSHTFKLFISLTRPLGALNDTSMFSTIRKRAIQFLVPYLLNGQLAQTFIEAIHFGHDKLLKSDVSLQNYLDFDQDLPNEYWQ